MTEATDIEALLLSLMEKIKNVAVMPDRLYVSRAGMRMIIRLLGRNHPHQHARSMRARRRTSFTKYFPQSQKNRLTDS